MPNFVCVMKKTIFIFLFAFLSLTNIVYSQCPMCKASAEASLKEGSKVATGINKGILYMLAAPYLLVGVIGFLWYKNQKSPESVE